MRGIISAIGGLSLLEAQIFTPTSLFNTGSKPFDEWDLEPPVALRWDFSTCGAVGRLGPAQDSCDAAYDDTNNGEGSVKVHHGVRGGVRSFCVLKIMSKFHSLAGKSQIGPKIA